MVNAKLGTWPQFNLEFTADAPCEVARGRFLVGVSPVLTRWLAFLHSPVLDDDLQL
jgi:hypothetical protein